MEREKHEHHDEGDDDDVSETDPVTFGFRRGLRAVAEDAPVGRHRSTRRLFGLASFVVQLLPAVVSEEKDGFSAKRRLIHLGSISIHVLGGFRLQLVLTIYILDNIYLANSKPPNLLQPPNLAHSQKSKPPNPPRLDVVLFFAVVAAMRGRFLLLFLFRIKVLVLF